MCVNVKETFRDKIGLLYLYMTLRYTYMECIYLCMHLRAIRIWAKQNLVIRNLQRRGWCLAPRTHGEVVWVQTTSRN